METLVRWVTDDNTIIQAEFSDSWTWEELHGILNEIFLLVAEVPHSVGIILQFQVQPPPGNPVTNFNDATKNKPANIGTIFVVPPNIPTAARLFFKYVSGVLQKLTGREQPIVVVETVAEAYRRLGHSELIP